ncbi:AAA domain-containing protein, partial [Effusibacillus consociatus]
MSEWRNFQLTNTDSETESRQQLEGSIDVITERLSSLDPDQLEKEAAILTKQRNDLIRQLRETRNRLKLARNDEYRPVVVAGEEVNPSQAARFVKEHEETESWIPGPVTLGEPKPLSHTELAELYRSNVELTFEEEKELGYILPDPAELLTPLEFESLVNERESLLQEDLEHGIELWEEAPSDQSSESLQQLLSKLRSAMEPLQDETEWRLVTILAGRDGEMQRKIWDELIDQVEKVYQLSVNTQSQLLEYAPELPTDKWNDQTLKVIDEILALLNRGKRITSFTLLFHSKWKEFLSAAKTNDSQPKTIQEFESLQMFVRLEMERKKLLQRWDRQVTARGGETVEELGKHPEQVCRLLVNYVKTCLDWYHGTWSPLQQEVIRQGFQWDSLLNEIPTRLSPYAEILRLKEAVVNRVPALFEAQRHRLLWRRNEVQLQDLREKADIVLEKAAESEVVNRLYEAIYRLDGKLYRETYEKLLDLYSQSSILRMRQKYLVRLKKTAPMWAAAIENRQGIHGKGEIPGDPSIAWKWRQFHDELEHRANTSMEELQNKIAHLSDNLRKITGALVEKKAWAAQVRRTTHPQRQALMGWKALVKKIGKGTGKRVPIFMAEARKLMPVCQTAVPVWIMPLNQVVENFDPRKNFFDVIIIDEASQSDIMALTALYMGKQVVVVGDDQQVSPDAVGQRVEEIQQMIDTFLKGIPNNQLYDGQSSIYDLAKTSFAGMVQLREHFRCVPDIIQFSNHLSYDGKIMPLRDASKVQRKPFSVTYCVENAIANDKLNPTEALHVASLLVAATEQPEYKDATFGVISLVGDEQAMHIETLLRQYLTPTEFNRRLIRCGNSAQFQGDERDVMFLSMVDSPKGDGPLTKRADEKFKKRFNVAASRARDQMWVVYSLDPDTDLKQDDLRRRLILHAKDPQAITRSIATLEKETQSPFEKMVLERLVRAGYRVKPQWQVGAYSIDLVVEGGGKRLAVECDGDKWHPPEKLVQDMGRQAILERLGWKFVRIRGSQFFRNPEKAMKPVFEKLKELNIPPEGLETFEEYADQREELRERIVRRAAELRQLWKDENYDPLAKKSNSITQSILSNSTGKIQEPVEEEDDIFEDFFEKEETPSVEEDLERILDSIDSQKLEEIRKLFSEQIQEELSGTQTKLELATTTVYQEDKQSFRLLDFFVERGIEVIDKRGAGGAFWVVGGWELRDTLMELKGRGLTPLIWTYLHFRAIFIEFRFI